MCVCGVESCPYYREREDCPLVGQWPYNFLHDCSSGILLSLTPDGLACHGENNRPAKA